MMLDILRQDPFQMVALTDAINKLPFKAGRAGRVIDWGENGVMSLTIGIEEVDGVITLINPTPRGGPGSTIAQRKRTLRFLNIPHYQRDDFVYPDEVRGVREFGQEQQIRTVQSIIDSKMAVHASDFDVTLEYQRLGAVKGVILNADGSTFLDLFAAFGVSQGGEVAFDLGNTSPILRKTCAGVVREVEDILGGTPIDGVHAFCGNAFFDDLLENEEVRDSYKNTPMAEVLRTPYVYPNGDEIYGAFEFGGIVFENYRGSGPNGAFVNTDKCHLFPVGPNLFKTSYGPADYWDQVNEIGKPRYSRQFMADDDKGLKIQMQMNAISYCRRPNALLQGRRGS